LGLLIPTVTADDKPCSAFTVNGSYPATFSFYRFYDFRNASLSQTTMSSGKWPADRDGSSTLVSNKTTNDSPWDDDGTVRVHYRGVAAKGLTELHYIPSMVSMGGEAGSAYLSLNTWRLRNNTQLGGEIFYSRADVDAISFRVSARVSGASGAVAGFFTYHNDTQESDIEILTKDGDGRVHFSNQPTTDKNEKIISDTTFNDSLPESTSINDWAIYRLDWLPSLDMSVWYVDGEQLRTTQTNVPQAASTVFIDMWSNSGWWSGDMAVGDQATLEIQWIEMAFNASATATSVPDDGVVCTIDEGIGSP
ncbi:concanavalin A-like lectin/glucanase domain-containing protein, partial [Ilyonectria sp. MPI-CAGE-AT-0026]